MRNDNYTLRIIAVSYLNKLGVYNIIPQIDTLQSYDYRYGLNN